MQLQQILPPVEWEFQQSQQKSARIFAGFPWG
jgi:hypothetical protein